MAREGIDPAGATNGPSQRPNVLFFHVDNLGFGELSCYSGGPFRGTSTDRIDAFAAQGFRLTNYAPKRNARQPARR